MSKTIRSDLWGKPTEASEVSNPGGDRRGSSLDCSSRPRRVGLSRMLDGLIRTETAADGCGTW